MTMFVRTCDAHSMILFCILHILADDLATVTKIWARGVALTRVAEARNIKASQYYSAGLALAVQQPRHINEAADPEWTRALGQ
eukprot:5676747-Pleurochrysis_carterae.AAC.1